MRKPIFSWFSGSMRQVTRCSGSEEVADVDSTVEAIRSRGRLLAKCLGTACAGFVLAVAGQAAHARGDVYWSVGVNSPGVALGVSNAPPVVVAAAPMYYAPAPVYVAPAPRYYGPRPIYVTPGAHYYGPPRGMGPRPGRYFDGPPRGYGHKHGHKHRHGYR
jgi:hypothetical protein